jgi:hypothetical protein
MAESLLGGILGEEDGKPDIEPSDALAGAQAFASAVAAKLAGNDPEVARKTVEFLSKQSQLLDTQNEHLKDEHAARLHYLQGQAREVDLRRLGLRLRVGFQVFLVLVATGIGAGAVLMVRDAATSRQVVIEPFRIPTTLATRGIDGAIVASGLLDELGRLQDATRSTSAARGLTGAWSGDIKLYVPETGISLGEISRLLRDRFGHDVHIDGDLVETPAGGVSLTVRGNGVPPKTIEGSADAEANAGAGTGVISAGPTIADIETRMHDPEAADLALRTAKEDPDDLPGNAMIHHVLGRLALEAGDFATAVAELEAYGTAYANPAVGTNNPGYHCWIAPAEEAARRPDKADAFLKSAGTFVDCYRFRADILDGRSNWTGAQQAYGDAVALAPDLGCRGETDRCQQTRSALGRSFEALG